ncbi:hypothetical protein JW851_01335 [Candidatus Woesearchaeota archaeon]|nr:hypothetical protein [Candidatus Woesearchaeota archaeon]
MVKTDLAGKMDDKSLENKIEKEKLKTGIIYAGLAAIIPAIVLGYHIYNCLPIETQYYIKNLF